MNVFIARHRLSPFVLGSLRPSVLTAHYRSTGDLRRVKEVANHKSISTTASYVQGPEVLETVKSQVQRPLQPSTRVEPRQEKADLSYG
jgi:hypothetical protein